MPMATALIEKGMPENGEEPRLRIRPAKLVERLKAEAAKRRGKTPPSFKLPPPVQEK